jgi:hypothetical protein
MNEPQKNWPPETHAHTHDFTLFDERIAPGLSAVTPRRYVSLAGCFGCRSPRVKGPLPSPLSTCPLYPIGPCLPMHSINLLLSLAVGAAAVISAAFVVFGLIDAFVPNSFFLPCLDRRRGHAQTGAADLHAGQLPVEGQVPEPVRALLSKAAVPAHAQRMSSLLAADKEYAYCRSRKGGVCNGGRGACREAGERVRGGSDGMHGARLKAGDQGHAQSARRTCRPCS